MKIVLLIFLLENILFFRIYFYCYYKVAYFNYHSKEIDDKITLILSLALKYSYSSLKNFINSLKKSKYNGTVIIFTYHLKPEFKKELQQNSIYNIELLQKYPFYPSNHKKYPIENKSIVRYLHYFNGGKFVTYRYFLYRLFIKFYGYKYKYIFMTDIRDVIFQLNPFQWNIKKGIFLVEEHPKKRIKDDIYNRRFIKDYQPSNMLYNSKVLNGGTIYSSYPEILYFLFDFLKYICSFNCNANDQGGLNSFIRNVNNYYYPIYILNSSHSPIRTLTLWIQENTYCCIPENNIILNVDKSIPHIIHQYDRVIKLNITNITFHNLYSLYIQFYIKLK